MIGFKLRVYWDLIYYWYSILYKLQKYNALYRKKSVYLFFCFVFKLLTAFSDYRKQHHSRPEVAGAEKKKVFTNTPTC